MTKGKHFIEWLRGENVSDNLAIFTEYFINNQNGWHSLHKLKYEAQIGSKNATCQVPVTKIVGAALINLGLGRVFNRLFIQS